MIRAARIPTQPVTITTDAKGKGAAEFLFAAGVAVALFDVMF